MLRRPAVLLVVAVTLAIAGCSGGPTGPGSTDPGSTVPEEPAFDPETWGVEWSIVPGSGPIDEETSYEVFGAAGALWMFEAEVPTVLHTTSDGSEWTTWDLAEYGLPADAFVMRGIDGIVRDDRGDAVTLVYGTYSSGDHPAGLIDRPWIVDIADDEVTVTAGADVGLETMPAPQADWAFRTQELRDFVWFHDTRYLIGDGQWWQPYRTSSVDAFIARETPTGWQVFSTNTPPLGGYDYLASPVAIEVVDDRLVVLTGGMFSAYPFQVWLSSDGVAWESVAPTFEGAGPDYRVRSVAVGAAGLVAVGIEDAYADGVLVAWTSLDGREWTRSVLPGGEGSVETVVATEAGYFALGEQDGDARAWTSPDGVDWSTVDTEIPFAARDAVPVADGLVAVTLWDLRTSGLDWGGAPE